MMEKERTTGFEPFSHPGLLFTIAIDGDTYLSFVLTLTGLGFIINTHVK